MTSEPISSGSSTSSCTANTCPKAPARARNIRIRIDGQFVDAKKRIEIPRNAKLELKPVIARNGKWQNIRLDPRTFYLPADHSLLTVSAEGIVIAAPSPNFEEAAEMHREDASKQTDRSGINIFYGALGDEDFGYGKLLFQIVDP